MHPKRKQDAKTSVTARMCTQLEWIIADGCIDFEPFVEGLLSTMNLPPNQAALCRESFHKTVQNTISATQSGFRHGKDNNNNNNNNNNNSNINSWSKTSKSDPSQPSQPSGHEFPGALHAPHPSKPAGNRGPGCTQPPGQSPRPWCLPHQRFIFVRGVQWSAVDTQFSQLAAALSNFLPTSFAG
eukprot:scaffold66041_cov21-Tisochrysis_lutea.AAC.1